MNQYIRTDRRILFDGPTSAGPRFVSPPVLRWLDLPQVHTYRVAVASESELIWQQDVAEPRVDLATSWKSLPHGLVDVLVRGLDEAGHDVAVRAHRRFWRVPGWDERRQVPLDWPAAIHASMRQLLAPPRDEVRPYEAGLPRVIHSNFEDTATGDRAQLAYPALHLPSFLTCFTLFASAYPDDPLAVEAATQAIQLGEWLLDNPLPADWACGGLPPSTIENGSLGGGIEGQSITLFRAARVAEAMLGLAAFTGDERFRTYAVFVARVLTAHQREDGSWPHRVDPVTGTVEVDYTSAAVTPVRLFALLEQGGDISFTTHRLAGEAWIASHPLVTSRWEGMYEDIPGVEPFTNLENWDVNETLRYLLDGVSSISSPVEHATSLNALIEDQFVVWQRERSSVVTQCPTPAVLEQYRCLHPMEVHTGNWLLSLRSLHHATGSAEYLDKAVAAANAIVRGQWQYGAFSTWGVDERFGEPLIPLDWPGCNAGATTALLRWVAYHDDLVAGRTPTVDLGGI